MKKFIRMCNSPYLHASKTILSKYIRLIKGRNKARDFNNQKTSKYTYNTSKYTYNTKTRETNLTQLTPIYIIKHYTVQLQNRRSFQVHMECL